MTGAPVRWALALIGSLLAHAALIAGLMVALRPDPVPDQPTPQSKLDVAAYTLERSQARVAKPDAPAATEDTAAGAALASGAIPQSRASAAEPRLTPAPATAPTAQRLATDNAPAPALAATPPDTAALTAARAPQARIATTAPTGAAVPATAPASAARLSAARDPAGRRLATTQPEPQAMSAVTAQPPAAKSPPPPNARLASQAAASVPAAALAPRGAALAPARQVAAALRAGSPTPPPLAPAKVVLASLTRTDAPAIAAARIVPKIAPVAAARVVPVPLRQSDAPLPSAAQIAPSTTALPGTSPDATATPEITPNAIATPEAAPRADPTPAAPPEAERMVAALAFAGEGADNADPLSLAAFQSFVRPGDPTAGGDALRDGVAGLLAQVPCSRLQVAFDPETATLSVNGHIPEGDLRAPVLAALRAQMGADITVSDNMLILPRPQCGSLSGIASVGLAQSTDQITNPLLIGDNTQARVLDFVRNDRLHFDLVAPDYDAFIYVDYFDAGGNVLHLIPNDSVAISLSPAASTLRVGTQSDADPGLRIFIGPPYGQEISVAFAASAPLYDGTRPLMEPAAPYLDWLKARVAQARADDPGFKGEWVYFFVTTADK